MSGLLPFKVPARLRAFVDYLDGTTETFECDVHGDGIRVTEDVTRAYRYGHDVITTKHQVSWETVEYVTHPRDPRGGWILNRVRL